MAKQRSTTTQRRGSYSAPALDKAFLIIELLASNPQGLLASEIATALGRSLGELFRIVVVMEDAGYLQKMHDSDRYTVTYKFLDVAYRATPARKLVVMAQPEMRKLAASVGQSCHLVVAQGGNGLVIEREENPGTRGFALRVGSSIDMVRSCSGNVLLAFSSDDPVEDIVMRAIGSQSDPVQQTVLRQRLEKVRADGFSLRDSPVARGVTDISFPIFGFGGELMAALTVPFLDVIDGTQVASIDETCNRLRQTSEHISQTLGWRSFAQEDER